MVDGIECICRECSQSIDPPDLSCPAHPETTPRFVYDAERLRERFDPTARTRTDLWRYDPLLPVDGTRPVTLGEGWTELISAGTLAETLGLPLELKLDGANPTGAAKDRGSSVVATYAREQGIDRLVCASTGNAAASIAAYAARGSLDCSLFVPDRLPQAKAIQPRVYDANLVTVPGGYGAAYERCRERAAQTGALDRSAGANPFTSAGSRTLGFELAEQAANAEWIAVSMGNGGTLADIWQGISLFHRMGYLEDPPRLLGVQAAGSPAIHECVRASVGTGDPATLGTCADSIDVDVPRRSGDAQRAIEESNGASIVVDDDQIRDALATLGREEGLFVEPAGAAALAGIRRARDRGTIDHGERTVAVLTGDGLKDTGAALEAVDSA